MYQRIRGGLLVAVLAVLAAGSASTAVAGTAAGAAASGSGAGERRSYEGEIGGSRYRVVVPAGWNGTLVMYSHGYYPAGFEPPPGIPLTNTPETETWLLDHGYALAGSEFPDGGRGFFGETALRDQIALLDWFEANVGRPWRTFSTGQSMGASTAILLAERHPGRFAGVATVCGAPDPNSTWNADLDITFAIKTLLATDPGVELARITNPDRTLGVLFGAIEQARATREGRARLALAASFNNVTGWFHALTPRPTGLVERINHQASWLGGAYVFGFSGFSRADLERKAGGNPSWNTGIDYRFQLARSSQREQVREAYAAAPGISLEADLDALAAAPRIAPDPAAVRFMYRFGVPLGSSPTPVITMHSLGDGGAVPDQERWYASQVRRFGHADRLRQLYVDRGNHCSFSAADEILQFLALERRTRTGQWPNLDPAVVNAAAAAFPSRYQVVTDIVTRERAELPPAFVPFTPPLLLRPSR